MGETLAIPPAATGDWSVITTHLGGPNFTGIREMRVYSPILAKKQNLAYEDPKVHKIPINKYVYGNFCTAGTAT